MLQDDSGLDIEVAIAQVKGSRADSEETKEAVIARSSAPGIRGDRAAARLGHGVR